MRKFTFLLLFWIQSLSAQTRDFILLQNLFQQSSSEITLPSNKTFYIDKTLFLNSGKTLNGNGSTIIQLSKYTPIISIKNTNNCTIKNVAFKGVGVDYEPSSSADAVAIDFFGATNVIIEKNRFSNFANVTIKGLRQVNNVQIIENEIIGTGNIPSNIYRKDHMGIAVGGENILIERNKISQTSQGVIIAEFSKNARIQNNEIMSIPLEHGIYIDTSCETVSILNNTIKDVGLCGIKIQNGNFPKTYCREIKIIGNTIENTGKGDGILLLNSESTAVYTEDATVENNILKNIGQHGINLREVKNAVIRNNIIDNVQRAALYTKNIHSICVSNNQFLNAYENGMFDEGGGTGNIFEYNSFLNVGIAGTDHNGLSSGIFSNDATGRNWENNTIVGSKNMQYGIYIVKADEKLNIKNNKITNARDYTLRFQKGNRNVIMQMQKSNRTKGVTTVFPEVSGIRL